MNHHLRHAIIIVAAAVLLALVGLPTFDVARAGAVRYGDHAKVILYDGSARLRPHTYLSSLCLSLWDRYYTLRCFGCPESSNFRFTPAAFEGVQVVILTSFDGSLTTGSPQAGTHEVDYNLSPEEIAAFEAFVQAGGSLVVVPGSPARANNLDALLARYGISYRSNDGRYLGDYTAVQNVPARVAGRTYSLSIPTRYYPLASITANDAETWVEIEGRPVVATVHAGAGQLIYFGVSSLVSAADELTVAEDDVPFVLDVFAQALDAPLLTPEEARQITWEARIAVLDAALWRRGRTLGGASVRDLMAGVAAGRRCDVGPSCVEWQITPEQRALLEPLAADEATLYERFDLLQQALGLGPYVRHPADGISVPPAVVDYDAVTREYRNILDAIAAKPARMRKFEELYVSQGGSYSRYPTLEDPDPLVLLGLALVALLLILGVLAGILIGAIRLARWLARSLRDVRPAS